MFGPRDVLTTSVYNGTVHRVLSYQGPLFLSRRDMVFRISAALIGVLSLLNLSARGEHFFVVIAHLGFTFEHTAVPYNTFDGEGFPACNNVAQVYRPSTVDEIVALVKDASSKGKPVRASGVCILLIYLFIHTSANK